jgi:hypothetical protein
MRDSNNCSTNNMSEMQSFALKEEIWFHNLPLISKENFNVVLEWKIAETMGNCDNYPSSKGCTIQIYLDVVFHTRMFFQSTIQSNTEAELTKDLDIWYKTVTAGLASYPKGELLLTSSTSGGDEFSNSFSSFRSCDPDDQKSRSTSGADSFSVPVSSDPIDLSAESCGAASSLGDSQEIGEENKASDSKPIGEDQLSSNSESMYRAHMLSVHGAKIALKVGNVGIKGIVKFAKVVPFVGFCIGVVCSVQRVIKGEYFSAAAEVASGVSSFLPGPGTVISFVIDGTIMCADATKAKVK